MNLMVMDNILDNPKEYVKEILRFGFKQISDGENVFKGIQLRGIDEFAKFVLAIFPDHHIKYNFVRQSPINQEEPNYIHKDDMMGDITVILYLNEEKPDDDGTTFYDENGNKTCILHSNFNRMVAFDANILHSRNIYENFGEGDNSRLIQVIFLKEKDENFN